MNKLLQTIVLAGMVATIGLGLAGQVVLAYHPTWHIRHGSSWWYNGPESDAPNVQCGGFGSSNVNEGGTC